MIQRRDANLAGSYLILNLQLNLFLSASTTHILGATPTPCTLATVPGGRTISTGTGGLKASSGQAVIGSTPSPVLLTRDTAQYFLIQLPSASLFLTGNTDASLSFVGPSPKLAQQWRFIWIPPASSVPVATIPGWLGLTRLGTIPNLPDGVYRFQHRKDNASVVVDDSAATHRGLGEVALAPAAVAVCSLTARKVSART
jgi:hypothetical protein